MNFDRFLVRRFNGHPTYSCVDMFYRVTPPTTTTPQQKHVFTKSFARDFTAVSSNMLITSANPLITKEICKQYKCKHEVEWITVPKHLSEVLMMDMVVLMNTYCDVSSKQQIWDLYYYVPSAIPLDSFRQILQLGDIVDDEEDLSLKP